MLQPEIVRIKSIKQNTEDVFTLTLAKKKGGEKFSFMPGQFNMLYLFGFGEVAISISGDPSKDEGLVHTIRAVGNVTKALQKLKKGDEIGIRGPFGTYWPLKEKGCDVLVIAGGVGLAPLRPSMLFLEANLKEYNKVTLLYGSRTPKDVLFPDDLRRWKEKGIGVEVTVDKGDESWKGHVGVVTKLVQANLPNPKKTVIFICGPEVMIQYALQEVLRNPVDPDKVYLSMERNMQCGVGFCGHCQYGPYFVCKDGPVFTYSQLKEWLPVHEL